MILTSTGNEKYLLRTVITGMVFSVVVNICLIPLFSYIGAAITNMFTEVVVTALGFHYVRKVVPFRIKLEKKIFLQALLGVTFFLPISFVVHSLISNFLVEEVVVIITCIAFYGFYLWFFVKNIYLNNIKELVVNKIGFGFMANKVVV